MQSDIERVLFDGPAIHKRLEEMAAQITADYSDRELTVIAILTGSLMFMSDLLRRIPLPLKLDCLSVVSYHGKTQTSGDVIFKQLAVPDVAGRDVLILDDILDTGYTLAAVRKKLEMAKPRSIRVCVLLSKRKHRARPHRQRLRPGPPDLRPRLRPHPTPTREARPVRHDLDVQTEQ